MSLLPNAMRIRDDFPFVLKRSIPVAAPVTKPKPVNDWAMATAGDKPPKMVRLRLTDEAQAEEDDFQRVHDGGNCSCHISPPCRSCTHPGNPHNLAEDDDAWVMGVPEPEPALATHPLFSGGRVAFTANGMVITGCLIRGAA